MGQNTPSFQVKGQKSKLNHASCQHFLHIVATATFKIIQHLEENSDKDGDFLAKSLAKSNPRLQPGFSQPALRFKDQCTLSENAVLREFYHYLFFFLTNSININRALLLFHEGILYVNTVTHTGGECK